MKMYEQKKSPVISSKKFYNRVVRNLILSGLIVSFSLALGTFGYHFIGKLSYIDAFYNSSMILTGMGPVNHIDCTAGKLFASFYALFSGLAFLTTIAVFLAPIIHRFMHWFHLETED